ncbi:hypothetical protein RP20_CCG017431 [Aedes albopictus]|nr:hypothetical protein RP20_CCG017431 [Aedes albopictus]
MIDHKVLNWFNSLSASSVRIRFSEGWCHLYFSNTFRNHICPLLLDIFTSFIGVTITVQNWSIFVKHVTYLSSILRYSSLTLASMLTGVWFLMQRKKYYLLVENLLHFDQCFSLIANTWSIETEASFTRIQIRLLIVSHVAITIIYIASFVWLGEYGFYSKILIICCVFIGFHFMLQQLYAVFFAEHLAERYCLLSRVVSQNSSQKILVQTLKLYDQLGGMQIMVSEVFGISCVITTLVVFLHTAVVFYSEMIYLAQGIPIAMIVAEVVTMIPIMVLFYAIMYSFDKLIVEILAAIVTYIMILFQFKDFEKT